MYLNFFGLHTHPFNITPDPALLYGTPSHNEAFAAVIYGIAERKGFIAIIGEVGVGKTMIIRCALEKLPTDKVRIVQLFNADLTFENLLRMIFESLGHAPPFEDVSGMVGRLNCILTDLYKAGINVVLVIDEAQNMPVETLHHLHLLSNLETEKEKLIQIVFSGQPEFEEKLNLTALRQLKQRVAIKVRILPLTRKDSLAYVSHRLSMAGHTGSTVFNPGALRLITSEAAGIPRIINTLCDNCLITAYGNRQRRVTASVAWEILRDFGGPRRLNVSWPKVRRQVPALAFLVAALSVIWLFGRPVPFPTPSPVAPVQKPAVAAQELRIAMPQRVLPPEAPPGRVKAVSITTKPVAVVVKSVKRTDQARTGRGLKTKGTVPAHKVVRKGDTLPKLILETYGSVNQNLIELVRHNNPRISTMDNLQGGERIYFPSRN